MPFAFVTIGVVIFITALNGISNVKAFGSQLYNDLFTASPSFWQWATALIVVGMIGYIPKAKKPADAFMVLIVLGMVLKNGGGIQKALQSLTSATTSTGTSTTGTTTSDQNLLNAAGSISVNSLLTTPSTTYTAPAGSILKSLGNN
jgi:hypothetical protein